MGKIRVIGPEISVHAASRLAAAGGIVIGPVVMLEMNILAILGLSLVLLKNALCLLVVSLNLFVFQGRVLQILELTLPIQKIYLYFFNLSAIVSIFSRSASIKDRSFLLALPSPRLSATGVSISKEALIA